MSLTMSCHALVTMAAAGALAAGALGCSRDPDIERRSIFVYSPRACAVSQSHAYSVIYAGGDFEPSLEAPPIVTLFLGEVGRTLSELPKETRSLVFDVSQGDLAWRGLTDVSRRGPVNVLVWPGGQSCRLSRDVERRTDMALGVFGRHFLVAGGRSPDGLQVPHTYVGDLTTGAIERLAIGLSVRRAHASITPFGGSSDGDDPRAALVAGGEDPESGSPLDSAELYVPRIGAPNDVGDFDGNRIALSEARTRHGSVVLASGETLLVGGRGAGGPLRTMEIVDPGPRRARTAGVALLRVPRVAPTVLRLASGEILVAGGLDSNGSPVPTLEWFSADASVATKRPTDLVAGRERALVPLEAGGALAVIAPEPGSSPDFKTVWVITADGTLEPALPVDPAMLDTVRLFPGAEGAPALFTGRRWMRWSPWFGAFQTISDAPAEGPTLDAVASGDSGLALWLEDRGTEGMRVAGFRFATRTPFGAVPKPLLVVDPGQLAPDRLAGFPGGSLHFDATRGLVLGPGTSAFLTDFTFADVEVELEVAGSAPLVVLRDAGGTELAVGGVACAFARAATQRLAVRRRGRRVDVQVDGAPYRSCTGSLEGDGRVSMGLRGPEGVGVTGARHLVVTRR